MTKTENRRRFVSIEEYRRNTGFSYKTVNHLLETGQIPYITTEGGYRKVDTLPGGDVSYKELTEKLDRLERAVCAMAKHFGVKG